MKVTLNWLKEYVDFDWTATELAERLTMLGLEVEGIEEIGGGLDNVVVAEILSFEKHPNADRLSVCRVADGEGERQIVCGAKNFSAGDKVPLALPGASLPTAPGEQPFVIKVGKMRGVESHGMLCAPEELGLAKKEDGLMILPSGARVGQPFGEYLSGGGKDAVLDLEITPNRPDLNSMIGIAREIAAVTGKPLRLPQVGEKIAAAPKAGAAEEKAAIRLEDPDLCPRYVARYVRGLKIGPSPDWLRQSLEKIGVRSINNVVDVTNYVMMETGQPLHAFDYRLLSKGAEGKPTIVVRRAAEGEKFVTLDEQEHTLSSDQLLIADETVGLALAGVMGGRDSEISGATQEVLLESAYFNPRNIRATSKKVDLRTESSYRFERGADIGLCDWASRRAIDLIIETAGGEGAEGVVEAYPEPVSERTAELRYRKTNELLGIAIDPEQQRDLLNRLGLTAVSTEDQSVTVRIPSFRVDIKREADLIEEVARLYGVDRIPSSAPRGAVGAHPFDAIYDQMNLAREILAGLGLDEAQGQTLISHEKAKLILAPASATEPAGVNAIKKDAPGNGIVWLENPLSSDMDALRPSLIPGLLDALRHNVNRKILDVGLFEIGRVFVEGAGQRREERSLVIAMTGARRPNFWAGDDRKAKVDLYDLKGVLEDFLEAFGVRGFQIDRVGYEGGLYVEMGEVTLGKLKLGALGQIHPVLARDYDLRDPVYIAELNLDVLLARRSDKRAFKALPSFPAVRRDVAMIAGEDVTHQRVLNVVKQAKPANLESVELFDVFRGKNIPEGRKSLAYAFTYRSGERTLTDEEVNSAHGKVVEGLKQNLGLTIRDS